MARRVVELTGPPGLVRHYLRSVLPGRRGEPGELPELRRTVPPDPARVDRYRAVCGYPAGGDTLPLCFPHLEAFGLHMRLMADPSFPFPLPGLVHVRNVITALRPLPAGAPLALRAWLGPVTEHRRGRAVEACTVASLDGEPVWWSRSAYLRREQAAGGSGGGSGNRPAVPPARGDVIDVPADTGRRYAAVSGDRNPIHLSALTARPFGFRTAIVHGMWSVGRCLAGLEPPDALALTVDFKRPLPLPTRVRLHADDDGARFALCAADSEAVHLTGTVGPPEATPPES